MEIDEVPPPFPDVVVTSEDSEFAKNGRQAFEVDDDDSESLPLPLPNDDFRSQSPMTMRTIQKTAEVEKLEKVEEDLNQKGDTRDTADVVTARDSEDGSEGAEDVENDDDDDWGDFGAAAAAPAQIQKPPAIAEDEDDDDDWGAFDEARPSTDAAHSDSESNPNSARSEAARQLAHQQSIEEWAPTAQGAVEAADTDDEWQAEFASAPAAPTAIPAPVEHLETLDAILGDDAFWDDGFDEEQEQDDVGFVENLRISEIPTIFDSETLKSDLEAFDSEEQRYARLWMSLRVVEEAISLQFDWKESRIRQNHFQAIKINPKVIKKEPRATAAAAFDTANLLLPSAPLQPTSSHTTSTSEDGQKAESPSIPAADFDWDTSGLTNPMNRANQNSAIIDVDFLSTNGVATSYTSPLQKELEEFGLVLANGASGNSSNSTGSRPNILETIMKTNGAARNAYRNPELLSLDAQKLLEKLPDLQYLQSEVLMFPIGTNLPH